MFYCLTFNFLYNTIPYNTVSKFSYKPLKYYRNFVATTAGGMRLIEELFQTYVSAMFLNFEKILCLLMFEIRCKITCIYTYLEKIMREQWLLYMHVHGHFNNVA